MSGPGLPSIVTRQEAGRRGLIKRNALYSKAQRDAWARMGGRRRNPTLDEIRAAEEAIAARLGKRHRPDGAEIRAEVERIRADREGVPASRRSRRSRSTSPKGGATNRAHTGRPRASASTPTRFG